MKIYIDEQIENTFKSVRRNALSNPQLYGGKYSQRNKIEAYNEYLQDYIIYLHNNIKKLNF